MAMYVLLTSTTWWGNLLRGRFIRGTTKRPPSLNGQNSSTPKTQEEDRNHLPLF